MANNEKLQMGLSLNVDLEAFEKEWRSKQADIQKIINSHTFDVKIGGIQGLAEVQKEMERFARGVRASSKVDLVNTDSIKGLKDEIRALEITWSGLSEAQKYANKETGELTEFATSLAKRYGELTTQLKEYGLTLKETAKDQQKLAQAQQASFDSIRRDAYQSMGQQDFGVAQLNEYYRQLEESSRRTKELSDAEAQRGAARYRESRRIQQEKQRELQLQREEYEALRQQLREESKLAGIQKNRRDNERYTSQQRRISEGKRIQQILSTEAKTLDAINQRLAIQRQRLEQAAIGSNKYKKIAQDIAALEARLRSLNGTQQRNIATTNAQTAAYRTQSGVLNGLKQFMNSYISLLGGVRFLSNIKNITAEFELQRVSLRAITQDAAFADSLFAKIKATAVESPFATKDLVTYTKQLAAYRIENEELYGTMQMLADVSAGLGVGMDRLILAYGQVKAASVLRGTELRQFTEAGIPLVDELAKKFSQLRGEVVTTGEVFDLISTRQVPFEMVADIFREMTAEGGRFYEMQKKQSESLYGVFENLKDNIQNAYDEIGQSNRGLLMGLGKLATVGAKNFDILAAAIAPLIVGMGAYRAATVLATKGTLGLSLSSNLLAKAEAALNLNRVSSNAQLRVQNKLMIRAAALQNKYAIAVLKANAAQNVFIRGLYLLKAAIIANPIGAALVGITAVVSALSAYGDKLRSVDAAQERAAKSGEEFKKAVEQDYKLERYNKIVDSLKEQETLLQSAKMSYAEFAKIFPELASRYKTQESRERAISEAQSKHQQGISALKTEYTSYFGYLDSEKSKVADLARGYADLDEAVRTAQITKLTAALDNAEDDLDKYQKRSGRILNKWAAGEGWWKVVNPIGFILSASGVPLNASKEKIGSTEAEISSYKSQIEALKKAGEDAEQAMIRWRKSYKELVDQTISTEELANLNFVTAAENANKKLKELTEEQQRLSNVPEQERDSNIEDRLKTLSTLIPKVQKWLDIYKQAKLEGSDTTPLDNLKSELSLVEKIYKRYQDLRKLMSDAAAKADIEKIYGGLTDIDFLDPKKLKERLQKMLSLAKAMGPKGEQFAIELGLKIQDIDLNEAKDKLEAALSGLSQQIKQQQDASEFFEKMLGLTGDVELSTRLALAVTGVTVSDAGVGGLFSQKLAEVLAQEPVAVVVPADFQVEGEWNVANIQKAINSGKVTVAQIRDVVENLRATGKDNLAKTLEGALESFVDYNKQMVDEMYETIDKFSDASTKIASLKARRDAAIMDSKRPTGVSDTDWSAYKEAFQRQIDEAIASIRFDEIKRRFAEELSNLDIISNTLLGTIKTELLNWLKTDEGSKASETDLKAVWDIVERIGKIELDRNPLEGITKAYENLAKARQSGDADAEEKAWRELQLATKATAKGIESTANAIAGVIDISLQLADALGITFSDDTMELINAFKDGLKLIAPIMTMVGAAMLFTADSALALETVLWPLLVITVAIASAFAAIKWISGAKVRKANKEIERQEKSLKNLERAYKRLEAIQDDLVGSDWVRNQYRQIDNLQKQVEAFQAQLNAERSKGKKADEDAIEDYKDKILDTQEEIRQLQQEVISEMAGTDLASAAKDFAQSWLDAYLSFDDTMGALKASFKDMMSSMVQNSMMAKLVQKRLEPVFDAIDKAYEDAELTPAEWQSILDMGNKAIEFIDDDLTHLAEMLGLREQLGDATQSDLIGIAKGAAQASEETVLTLAGYANSLLYYQIWLKNDVAAIRAILEGRMAAVSPAPTGEGGFNVGQLVSLQQQSLSQLQAINLNTGNTVSQLQTLNDKIDSIISTAGTSSRKVVNTRLSN